MRDGDSQRSAAGSGDFDAVRCRGHSGLRTRRDARRHDADHIDDAPARFAMHGLHRQERLARRARRISSRPIRRGIRQCCPGAAGRRAGLEQQRRFLREQRIDVRRRSGQRYRIGMGISIAGRRGGSRFRRRSADRCRIGSTLRAVTGARRRQAGTEALKLDYSASLRNESFMQFFVKRGECSLENPLPTLLRANRIDLPIKLQGDVSGNEPQEQYRILHPVLNSTVSAPWRLMGCGVAGVGRLWRARGLSRCRVSNVKDGAPVFPQRFRRIRGGKSVLLALSVFWHAAPSEINSTARLSRSQQNQCWAVVMPSTEPGPWPPLVRRARFSWVFALAAAQS